jgi:hypothetical protein
MNALAKSRTKALVAPRAGWLIAALGLLPFLQTEVRAEEVATQSERLEWLLATHDVRYALQTQQQPKVQSTCVRKVMEHTR